MERAHVRAWPALRTERINGWLWRSSGGGSQRANSVSTVDFSGVDFSEPDAAGALDAVEARYAAAGGIARFQLFDDSRPLGLAELLASRGYTCGNMTRTMFRRPGRVGARGLVEIRDDAWDEWLDVYLGEITANRRAVNREILRSVPEPRAFFGYRSGGRIVSTALCVVGFGCAVIECVATRVDSRRLGAGWAVMGGLLDWASRQDADLVGLQVVADNAPAIQLYEKLNFAQSAFNAFWTRGLHVPMPNER